MTANVQSFLSNFDKKPMFDEVQQSDSKEDLSVSGSVTFEVKIKVKGHVCKATLPNKCQKLIPTIIKLKQT